MIFGNPFWWHCSFYSWHELHYILHKRGQWILELFVSGFVKCWFVFWGCNTAIANLIKCSLMSCQDIATCSYLQAPMQNFYRLSRVCGIRCKLTKMFLNERICGLVQINTLRMTCQDITTCRYNARFLSFKQDLWDRMWTNKNVSKWKNLCINMLRMTIILESKYSVYFNYWHIWF